MKKCEGKTKCSTNFDTTEFLSIPEQDRVPNLTLFAQVSCKQSPEDLVWKNRLGCAICGIGIAMVLWFQIYVDKLYTQHQDMTRKMDQEILSAKDFTVKCDIPEACWKEFTSQYDEDKHPNAESNLSSFRDLLIR